MGWYSIQISIFICGFINIGTFTISSPFLTGFLKSKDVDMWIVGLAYSIEPVLTMASGYFVGIYMEKYGRRFMMILGNSIFGVGTGLMYLYTITNTLETIILLFVTRSLAGIAYGIYFTTAYAIITSEYSDTMNRTVALFENCIGLGMISGPLIGNILRYLAGDCFEFLGYSLTYIITIPITYHTLSELKPYTITKSKIHMLDIIKKPVIFTQFILIDSITLLIAWVNLRVFILAIQVHLEDFGASQNTINYLYSAYCLGYFLQSMFLAVFHNYNQLGMMIFGMGGMGICLIMMAPWDFILDREFYYVAASMPLFGVMFAALYGKIYLVPAQPHMITVAKTLYKFPDDDRLNDGISSISMIFQQFGGVFGPLAGGFYLNYFSIDSLFVVIALITIGYGLLVSSYVLVDKSIQNNALGEGLIEKVKIP